jgi:hypothetical protein
MAQFIMDVPERGDPMVKIGDIEDESVISKRVFFANGM